MSIVVKVNILSGKNTASNVFEVAVDESDSVAALKAKIAEAKGIKQQRLVHKGFILEDRTSVAKAGIKSGDVVTVYCTGVNA